MKMLVHVLALLVIVGLATTVQAAKGEKGAHAGLRGRVVKVEGTNVVIEVGKKTEAKEVTVATDSNTKVTIDGAEGKTVNDLVQGMGVSITPETGTAQKIEAKTIVSKKKK